MPDYFFVSIFQELIYKQKEFRVLYFYGECYPVEILSQENNYSSLDSRKRSKNEDNTRLIKTTLPNSLISKLDNFMKSIDLNIGSIDVIQSINDKYYFLEVNPVGQISSYSSRTNINFEKMIVEKMIQIDDEYKNNK